MNTTNDAQVLLLDLGGSGKTYYAMKLTKDNVPLFQEIAEELYKRAELVGKFGYNRSMKVYAVFYSFSMFTDCDPETYAYISNKLIPFMKIFHTPHRQTKLAESLIPKKFDLDLPDYRSQFLNAFRVIPEFTGSEVMVIPRNW